MLETKERPIGERIYRVTPLPGMRALKLMARLGRVAGPSFALMGQALAGATDLATAEIDMEKLGRAVGELFAQMDDTTVDAITKELLQTGQVLDGDKWLPVWPSHIDLAFAGDMPSLLKLLAFAIEVNFGNFTEVVRAVIAARPRPAPAKPSPSAA